MSPQRTKPRPHVARAGAAGIRRGLELPPRASAKFDEPRLGGSGMGTGAQPMLLDMLRDESEQNITRY